MRYFLFLSCLFSSLYSFAQNRQGKDRALFFAGDSYEQLTDLKNPIKNAQDIAEVLEDNYDFLTEVVPNPSLEEIEQKIAYYQKQYQRGLFDKEGQLLIFFTGHGDRRGNNGYFMPKDANPSRPHVTAIEYDYWRNEINQIDCQHILVAIDACHSLTFDPNWENKPNRDFQRKGEQFADKVLLNHQKHRARLFFTSDGTGNETPDRSTFAKQFLTGLRTHFSTTNYLTSSELFGSYLKKAAPTPGGGDFGSDEAGSTFLFFKKSRPNLSNTRTDRADWQTAQNTNTLNAYRRYIQQHPNGDFQPLAQQKIDLLEQEEQELNDWEITKQTNTPNAYETFISKYPNSIYVDVAQLKINQLEPLQPDNFIFVKGGNFQMGSDEEGNEQPIHSVTLSDFYISPYEVTFEDYDAFCTATGKKKPDDEGWGRGKRPVINVNWYDAIEYCNWLSKKQGLTPVYSINKSRNDPNNESAYDDLKWTVMINWQANGYRLSTEAEWEYAARSRGNQDTWAGTSNESDLSIFGNFCDRNCTYSWKKENQNDGYKNTAPIGSFQPNSLGLYDMSGNVWEWCWDWYDAEYYSKSTNTNPKGPDTGSLRVVRGGSWYDGPASLRCAYRDYNTPDFRNYNVGFRLSRAGS